MELAPFIQRVAEYYDDNQLGFPSVVTLDSNHKFEKQEDTIHGMPFVLVEQYSQGMDGDSWYGNLYFPLKKKKFIKVPFYC